jgi:hypothetical protein
MTGENYYEGLTHIVHVSTDIGTSCEQCSTPIGLEDFAKSVNHHIEQHAYKVLHVGTETSHDMDGKVWHSTVAVLGK